MVSKNSEKPDLFQVNPSSAYLQVKPFYHSNMNKTLENILLNKKPVGRKGVIEKLFSEKTKTLKAVVKSFLEEIEIREKLDLHILNRIDEDICKKNTRIMQLESLKANYSLGDFLEIKKIILKIEDKVLELEKEKRKEYLECWRDLMSLKKYLLVSFKDYWNLVKRRELLEENIDKMVKNELDDSRILKEGNPQMNYL
jgi:hypothetical protein